MHRPRRAAAPAVVAAAALLATAAAYCPHASDAEPGIPPALHGTVELGGAALLDTVLVQTSAMVGLTALRGGLAFSATPFGTWAWVLCAGAGMAANTLVPVDPPQPGVALRVFTSTARYGPIWAPLPRETDPLRFGIGTTLCAYVNTDTVARGSTMRFVTTVLDSRDDVPPAGTPPPLCVVGDAASAATMPLAAVEAPPWPIQDTAPVVTDVQGSWPPVASAPVPRSDGTGPAAELGASGGAMAPLCGAASRDLLPVSLRGVARVCADGACAGDEHAFVFDGASITRVLPARYPDTARAVVACVLQAVPLAAVTNVSAGSGLAWAAGGFQVVIGAFLAPRLVTCLWIVPERPADEAARLAAAAPPGGSGDGEDGDAPVVDSEWTGPQDATPRTVRLRPNVTLAGSLVIMTTTTIVSDACPDPATLRARFDRQFCMRTDTYRCTNGGSESSSLCLSDLCTDARVHFAYSADGAFKVRPLDPYATPLPLPASAGAAPSASAAATSGSGGGAASIAASQPPPASRTATASATHTRTAPPLPSGTGTSTDSATATARPTATAAGLGAPPSGPAPLAAEGTIASAAIGGAAVVAACGLAAYIVARRRRVAVAVAARNDARARLGWWPAAAGGPGAGAGGGGFASGWGGGGGGLVGAGAAAPRTSPAWAARSVRGPAALSRRRGSSAGGGGGGGASSWSPDAGSAGGSPAAPAGHPLLHASGLGSGSGGRGRLASGSAGRAGRGGSGAGASLPSLSTLRGDGGGGGGGAGSELSSSGSGGGGTFSGGGGTPLSGSVSALPDDTMLQSSVSPLFASPGRDGRRAAGAAAVDAAAVNARADRAARAARGGGGTVVVSSAAATVGVATVVSAAAVPTVAARAQAPPPAPAPPPPPPPPPPPLPPPLELQPPPLQQLVGAAAVGVAPGPASPPSSLVAGGSGRSGGTGSNGGGGGARAVIARAEAAASSAHAHAQAAIVDEEEFVKIATDF